MAAIKLDEKNVKLLSKFPWQWVMIATILAIITLFGVVMKNHADERKMQAERIEYLRNYIKDRETDKATWLKEQSNKSDAEIKRQQVLIDSLQRLILNRTDKNYQELKDILDIRGKDATISIRPKPRR
ncbi:hypothetical protein [Pedobacter sp. CFBP9032]|uniref:hypothetical protein n=1 Tax=Pedobacter sp. CFBP9032 TaxID=3096539 RepID=UPI002A6A62A8|nr:hypothetical protein [Pedobacter sp. CFBP9032]MDY0906561.1 hypothetical protein [Pedobacter sp. CFBP9032]